MTAAKINLSREADQVKVAAALGSIGFDWAPAVVQNNTATFFSEPLVDQHGNMAVMLRGLRNRLAGLPVQVDVGDNGGKLLLAAHLPQRFTPDQLDEIDERMFSLSGQASTLGVVSKEADLMRLDQQRLSEIYNESLTLQETESWKKADIHMIRRMLQHITKQPFRIRGEMVTGPVAYFDGKGEAQIFAGTLRSVLNLPADALPISKQGQDYVCPVNIAMPPGRSPEACKSLSENFLEVDTQFESARFHPATLSFVAAKASMGAQSRAGGSYGHEALQRKHKPAPERGS